jgi:hypothetical protein
MSRDKSIVQSNPRVAANRHRNGIEQTAAADLENNRRARIRGEEPTEYVPLWKRV